MTEASRVGEKGQAVIPKAIRDAAGIRPGDAIVFRIEEGRVFLEKVGRSDVVTELTRLVPRKLKEPKRIDWSARYEDRFQAR